MVAARRCWRCLRAWQILQTSLRARVCMGRLILWAGSGLGQMVSTQDLGSDAAGAGMRAEQRLFGKEDCFITLVDSATFTGCAQTLDRQHVLGSAAY